MRTQNKSFIHRFSGTWKKGRVYSSRTKKNRPRAKQGGALHSVGRLSKLLLTAICIALLRASRAPPQSSRLLFSNSFTSDCAHRLWRSKLKSISYINRKRFPAQQMWGFSKPIRRRIVAAVAMTTLHAGGFVFQCQGTVLGGI